MGLKEKLEVLVDANVGGFVRGMEQAGASAEKNLGKTDDRVKRMSAGLTTWGAAVAGAGVVGAIGLGKLASMAAEAEKQQLKLTNSVQNSGQTFKDGGQAIRDQARELQKFTAVEDDASVGASALLVQFGLTEDQVLALQPLVGDLSRKMGVDLDTAAKAVGKSATGTTTALKRMGIDVQTLGDGSSAAEKTISALRKSVGGFAEQEGATFQGRLESLRNQLGDIGENVGSGVIDVIKPLADVGTKLGDISPQAANVAGKVATIGVAGATAAGGLAFIVGQGLKVRDVLTTVGDDGVRSLTGVGRAAKVAGIGLAALTAGLVLDQLGKSDSKQYFDRIAAASDKSTKAILTNLGQAGRATKGFTDNFTGAFDGVVKFGDGFGQSISDIDRALGDAYKSGNFDAIKKGITALREASKDPLNTPVKGDITAVIKDYTGKLKDSAAAAKASGDASAQAGDSVEGSGQQVSEAAAQWDEYANSIKKATDPFYAAQKAAQDFGDAQLKVAEAQDAVNKQPTAENLLKLAAAQQDAVVAGQDQMASMAALRAEIEKNPAAVDEAIAVLEQLKLQQPQLAGAINQTEASIRREAFAASAASNPTQQLTASINGLKATAGDITWRVAVLGIEGAISSLRTFAVLSASVKAVIASTQAAIAAAGGADGNIATPTAMGGRRNAGQVLLVGEQGPEIWVPDAAGTMIPNNKIRGGDGVSLSGGQQVINQTITFNGPVTDEQWVIDAISKANRRGMTSLAP